MIIGEKESFIILGNPGIGKSMFLLYMLVKLVAQKETVVYDPFWDKKSFLFSAGTMKIGELEDFVFELSNASTWYLVDGKEPAFQEAKTLLVSSPNPKNYKEFHKLNTVKRLFMPIWTWEEIQECKNILYSSLPEEKVEELFMKWGGIPRFVLGKAMDETNTNLLDEAISAKATRLKELISYIGESDTETDVSHKLLHIIVHEGYTTKHIAFASDYVANKIIGKYWLN